MNKLEAEEKTEQLFAASAGYAIGNIYSIFIEHRTSEVKKLIEKVLPNDNNTQL